MRHDDVSQYDLKSERYKVRNLNCQDHGQALRDETQNSVQQHQNQVLPTRQQMFQQGAQEVETKSFDGSPINYQYFKIIFKEVIENKVDDPRRRLKTHHVHSRRSQRINQNLHTAASRSWLPEWLETIT